MAVLSIAGLICKIVGALYRIPLSYIIGEEGMATYQLVFPTYNILLNVSSAGLPVAISRMVSFFLAKDDPRNAKRTFHIALCMLAALGCITMMLMLVFSSQLAVRTGDPTTQPGFVAIAPALLLVCTMAAIRGFIQGQQNMVPTAISQLIEQVGKVAICLPLAYFGMRISVAYAAAGMLLGTSIAEAVALLFMFVTYRRKMPAFRKLEQDPAIAPESRKALLRQVIAISVPITINSCIVPMSGFIDSGMILNRLLDAGMALEIAKPLYGCYSGYVLTLINVPTAISAAISMSLVPSVSAAVAGGDPKQLHNQCRIGLRMACLIGLPCSIGMSMLAKPLLGMIYHFSSDAMLTRTAQLLTISGFTIVLFTVVQCTTGILNGMKKQIIPMITQIIGVACKIALNYTLIGNPSVQMFGAPIASVICYTLALIPNLYFVHKYTGMKIEIYHTFLKPLLATMAMAAVIFGMQLILPDRKAFTLVTFTVAVVAYFAVAFAIGAVTKQDVAPFLRRFNRKKSQEA